MITIDTYRIVKEKYGQCSSWAVWDFSSEGDYRFNFNKKGYYLNNRVKEFNNISTNEDIKKLGLQSKTVIVALNFGKRVESIVEFEGITEILEKLSFFFFS